MVETKHPEAEACGPPDLEGAHAAALERMVAEHPPFRPGAPSEELVAAFANGETRFPAFLTLYSRGHDALPAVREGLRSADGHVRRWCALFLDNFADAEAGLRE